MSGNHFVISCGHRHPAICRLCRTFPCISVIIPASFHSNGPHVTTLGTSAFLPRRRALLLGSGDGEPLDRLPSALTKTNLNIVRKNAPSHSKMVIFQKFEKHLVAEIYALFFSIHLYYTKSTLNASNLLLKFIFSQLKQQDTNVVCFIIIVVI